MKLCRIILNFTFFDTGTNIQSRSVDAIRKMLMFRHYYTLQMLIISI